MFKPGVCVCLAVIVMSAAAIEADLLALLLFGPPVRLPSPLYTARGVLLPWGEFVPYPNDVIPWIRRGPIHPRFFRDRPDPPDRPAGRGGGRRGRRRGGRRGGEEQEEGARRRRRQRNRNKKPGAGGAGGATQTTAAPQKPAPQAKA